MTRAPRLTIGLPVYNGERYLAAALDSLLGQTYADFELIISDNASTDSTPEICRRFQQSDSRVRVFRQRENIGLAGNHNFVFDQAEADLFKWAAHDDLYAPEFLSACIEALAERPEAVLAQSRTAVIDPSDRLLEERGYLLTTGSSSAPERFRSVLFDDGGDDDLGILRTSVMRRVPRKQSHHRADRTFTIEICLHGPFHNVPAWLYLRREHPGRVESAANTTRAWCSVWDPKRADRLRHPTVRLYGEQILALLAAIQRAPLSASDRRACYSLLVRWLASHAGMAKRKGRERSAEPLDPATVSSPAEVANS